MTWQRALVAANRVSYCVPVKIPEAAAHGVPVTITDEVDAYLGWRADIDILCCEESQQTAQACIQLYENAEPGRKDRAGARKYTYS